MRELWSYPVSNDEAARRAGGRRAYNLHRHLLASFRQCKVMERLLQLHRASGRRRGLVAQIAREFRVSRRTIHRHIKASFEELLKRDRTPIDQFPKREQLRELIRRSEMRKRYGL